MYPVMSNFQNKGKRNSIKKQIRETRKKVKLFQESLMAMNHVYHILKDDKEVTKDNLENKLSLISNYNFNEFELDLLREDLCKK